MEKDFVVRSEAEQNIAGRRAIITRSVSSCRELRLGCPWPMRQKRREAFLTCRRGSSSLRMTI